MPAFRFHEVRHTGTTLAAATGASTKELMALMGHASMGAALSYQHATADRDHVFATALSRLATGDVAEQEGRAGSPLHAQGRARPRATGTYGFFARPAGRPTNMINGGSGLKRLRFGGPAMCGLQ